MKRVPLASASEAGGVRLTPLILFTCWLASGALLEVLLAFKARPYVENDLRREMWTLAHAHGALLALAWFAIGSIVHARLGESRLCMMGDRLFGIGAILVPMGFLLGGAWHPESDPGIGVLLTPVGAACCVSGLVLWILALRRDQVPRADSGA